MSPDGEARGGRAVGGEHVGADDRVVGIDSPRGMDEVGRGGDCKLAGQGVIDAVKAVVAAEAGGAQLEVAVGESLDRAGSRQARRPTQDSTR